MSVCENCERLKKENQDLNEKLQEWYKYLNYQQDMVTYLAAKDELLEKIMNSPRRPIGHLPEFDQSIFKR